MFKMDLLIDAINNNDAKTISELIKQYNLKIEHGKITADKEVLKLYDGYWDKAQHIRKINLNATFGILLNSGCRFFDKRLGQSITLTGRQIVKHMTAHVNEIIAGEYDYLGKSIAYNDTDSIFSGSIINTSDGLLTVNELFNRGVEYYSEDTEFGIKEYSLNDTIKVLSYDSVSDTEYYGNINYVYRHKVSKERWEIEDADGNTVIVTGDHSIMVERCGSLIEVKPCDILVSDVLITVATSGK